MKISARRALELFILFCLLPAGQAAAQSREKRSIRVVGFDDQSETALVHVEVNGPSVDKDQLELVVLALPSNHDGPGWVLAHFNGYEGLPEWMEQHPSAKPEEIAAAARRLRGANWKKMQKELGLTGVRLKSGEQKRLSYTVDDKLQPVARQDAQEGERRVSRFAIPALEIVLKQTCSSAQSEGCTLVSERGRERILVLDHGDVAAIYVDPRRSAVVIIERTAELTSSGMLPGVHVFDAPELQPAPAAACKPGEVYLVQGCPWGHCSIHWSHALLDQGSLVSNEAVKVVPDDAASPDGQTVLVKVVKPDAQRKGGWATGWVHPRLLAPKPLPKAEAALLDLELTDAVVGEGKAARYRVTLRNGTTETVDLPKGILHWNYLFQKANVFSRLGEFGARRIAPGGEVVLFEGVLLQSETLLDPTSETDLPAQVLPIEHAIWLGFERPLVGPCLAAHSTALPVRVKTAR